jgi:hypothetical protein
VLKESVSRKQHPSAEGAQGLGSSRSAVRSTAWYMCRHCKQYMRCSQLSCALLHCSCGCLDARWCHSASNNIQCACQAPIPLKNAPGPPACCCNAVLLPFVGTPSSQQQSSKPQQEQQQSSARSAPQAAGSAPTGAASPQTFARQLHTALLQGIVSMLRADSLD